MAPTGVRRLKVELHELLVLVQISTSPVLTGELCSQYVSAVYWLEVPFHRRCHVLAFMQAATPFVGTQLITRESSTVASELELGFRIKKALNNTEYFHIYKAQQNTETLHIFRIL